MVNNHNQQIIFGYFFWWPAHSPAGFWWSRHLEIDLELVDKEHPDGEASMGSEVVNMGKKTPKMRLNQQEYGHSMIQSKMAMWFRRTDYRFQSRRQPHVC